MDCFFNGNPFVPADRVREGVRKPALFFCHACKPPRAGRDHTHNTARTHKRGRRGAQTPCRELPGKKGRLAERFALTPLLLQRGSAVTAAHVLRRRGSLFFFFFKPISDSLSIFIHTLVTWQRSRIAQRHARELVLLLYLTRRRASPLNATTLRG